MMPAASLDMLIELTRNEVESVYRQLRRLASARAGAEQRMQALQSYRRDYAQRLRQSSKVGLPASNYHNFTRFIATLDDAITQQNKVMAQIDARLRGERQQWRAHEQRLRSYETLRERDLRTRRYQENRREQQTSDEIARNLTRRPFADERPLADQTGHLP